MIDVRLYWTLVLAGITVIAVWELAGILAELRGLVVQVVRDYRTARLWRNDVRLTRRSALRTAVKGKPR
jgi:hypothetical protein